MVSMLQMIQLTAMNVSIRAGGAFDVDIVKAIDVGVVAM